MSALLEVANLEVSFRTEQGMVRAVDDVSFTVGQGEILGVVGESGSGKTISLLSTLGLISDPNAVVKGRALWKGRDLLTLDRRALRRLRGGEIAMIFQDPMTALTPVYTVGWQIAEAIRAHQKLGRRAARQRAVELLAEVGLPDPRRAVDRYPHQLSGGMRQRAVIAMALANDPALLIADEPTTALDVTVQAQVLDLIRKLRRDHGSAVVLVTHDMGVVAEIADRVMVMYGGRVVERGTRAELFTAPWHPYTQGLLASIPPMEGGRPRRLTAIPGSPPSPARMPAGCSFAPRCPHRFAACAVRPDPLPADRRSAACYLPPPPAVADAAA